VLSGELDPVLPPSWGELVTNALPNARHVVVPAAAHGVTQVACVPELIARFVGELRLDALDTSCVQLGQRAAFFTTPTGPSQEGLP
jgi:pimeloyl-ACP methyl ester carboxylesterase